MKTITARLIACSFAGSLVLAACGGSSSSPRAVSAGGAHPAATTTSTSSAPVPTTSAEPKTVPATTATTLPIPTTAAPTAPPAAAPTTTAPAVTTVAIDLSGTPGVTPEEQLRAEKLIENTITDLKFFQTPAQAYAAGYRSIGDSITGDEHYVNWSYVTDAYRLDPERPESVVYENRDGKQQAVAAMYMLPFGSTFAQVPDVGGSLTQWHVHRNLCLTNNPQQKIVAGITSLDGGCRPGTSKAGDTPMLHVWVVPNPCGPFAALEGIGAGQVPKGETRQCSGRYANVP